MSLGWGFFSRHTPRQKNGPLAILHDGSHRCPCACILFFFFLFAWLVYCRLVVPKKPSSSLVRRCFDFLGKTEQCGWLCANKHRRVLGGASDHQWWLCYEAAFCARDPAVQYALSICGYKHSLTSSLDLTVMTLDIVSPLVYTKVGVPITVSSVAQVRISRYPDTLKIAASQFLGMTRSEVERVATQTLVQPIVWGVFFFPDRSSLLAQEGHQRAIMGTLTVEEIYMDRKKFAVAVREVAAPDVGNLGIEIVSYTIKDVKVWQSLFVLRY